MLLKEAPTLFPQHLKNSLLNLGLIDKETRTLSTLNTVIFRANKVWFLCWILSELPPAAATNKQIVGSVSAVVENPCPANGSTRREEMKILLRQLEDRYPNLRKKIFGAIQRYPLYGWSLEEDQR